jgi:hypothetical protein
MSETVTDKGPRTSTIGKHPFKKGEELRSGKKGISGRGYMGSDRKSGILLSPFQKAEKTKNAEVLGGTAC